VAEAREELRWGMERRLEFIEFRLFWEGHVNRSDLMDTFKVSIAQATTDLNRYLALAPGNMVYDKSAKAYVRTPEFKARFQEPEPGRYLNQLRSVGDGIVEAGETWIGHFPAFDAAPTSGHSPLGGCRHPSERGDRDQISIAVAARAEVALDRTARPRA